MIRLLVAAVAALFVTINASADEVVDVPNHVTVVPGSGAPHRAEFKVSQEQMFRDALAVSFEEYPVTMSAKPKGKVELQMKRGDNFWDFRTQIRHAAKDLQPNFAGHYKVAYWPATFDCQIGIQIDVYTGELRWMPLNCLRAEYRADSRMLVVNFALPVDRYPPGFQTEYYTWDESLRKWELVLAYDPESRVATQ